MFFSIHKVIATIIIAWLCINGIAADRPYIVQLRTSGIATNNPKEHPTTQATIDGVSIRMRGFFIPPEGDYSKIDYSLVAEKYEYDLHEPVWVRFVLKNQSDTPIVVENDLFGRTLLRAVSLSVCYSTGTEATLTSLGVRTFQTGTIVLDSFGTTVGQVRLAPHETISSPKINIGLYYDLSRSGEYSIVSQLYRVHAWELLEKPLESKMEFRINPRKYSLKNNEKIGCSRDFR